MALMPDASPVFAMNPCHISSETAPVQASLPSLTLLAVIVIECGGGLALPVRLALGEGVHSGQVSTANVNPARPGVHGVDDDRVDACGRSHQEPPSNRAEDRQQGGGRSVRARVLQALIERGGVLSGSQQAMSTPFGWSKSRMNTVLHELKAAGEGLDESRVYVGKMAFRKLRN